MVFLSVCMIDINYESPICSNDLASAKPIIIFVHRSTQKITDKFFDVSSFSSINWPIFLGPFLLVVYSSTAVNNFDKYIFVSKFHQFSSSLW